MFGSLKIIYGSNSDYWYSGYWYVCDEIKIR